MIRTKFFLTLTATALILAPILGCSSSPKGPLSWKSEDLSALTPQDSQTQALKTEIDQANSLLQQQKWSESKEAYDRFLASHPVSIYTLQASYGVARAEEGLGHCSEAVPIYRKLGEQARTLSPATAGLAYYRLSFCYEIEGDEIRMTAALNDAKTFSESLPKDVREIRIPVRLGTSFLRRGLTAEAREYFAKAEKALPDVSPSSPEEMRNEQAELLYEMGQLDMTALAPENFLTYVDTFETLEVYLLKSSLLNSATYSPMAKKSLTEQLQRLAKIASAPKIETSGLDALAKARQERELQKRWLGRVLELLQVLKNYNGLEGFPELIQMEKEAQAKLWAPDNGLTAEPKPKRN